jgi:kumamolisin
MKRMGCCFVLLIAACCLIFPESGAAQGLRKGHIVVPQSSAELPADVGVNAHTHILAMMPENGRFDGTPQPSELPPFLGFFFETPASIACVYNLVSHTTPGCNPDKTAINPQGGAGAIAVVDAFDDPNAAVDLAAFSKQFGLPPAQLQVVFAGGTRPKVDPTGGWELEESLDIEWSHAMAPNAKIFLVEANSNSFNDLFTAIILAAEIVASNGGGEVSMSFGGGEFTQETLFDGIFTQPGVVYIASTSDAPALSGPALHLT